MFESLTIQTREQGLLEITNEIRSVVQNAPTSEGLCTIFIRHTSASLTIQENADFSAKRDLEHFLNKLVPENDPDFTHVHEGPDDMPSHIKSALTSTTLSIPFSDNDLLLGTWQGIYLWEHRRSSHSRSVVLKIIEG